MKEYMKKSLILIGLFAFFLTLILGCSLKKEEANKKTYAVGIRFSSSKKPPRTESDPGSKPNYYVKPGETFSGYYEVINAYPKRHSYVILTFIDYKQVKLRLNKKLALTHDISLAPGQKKWWNFETTNLDMGFHDFAMVVLWYPKIHVLEKNFRTDSQFFYSIRRANLIVGSQEKPHIEIRPPINKEPQQKGNGYDGVTINKSKNDLSLWLKEESNPKSNLDYHIHVGNNENEPKKFALIALLDYKQIPIKQDGPLVVFGNLAPNEIQTFSASVKVPNKKGIHELQIIRMLNPYLKIGYYDDDKIFSESSIRVPIIVK